MIVSKIKANATELWNQTYSNEPFDFLEARPKADIPDIKITSYDIAAAMKRQRNILKCLIILIPDLVINI